MTYANAIQAIALRHWGNPNQVMSTPGKELRYGTHGSKSINLLEGTWFDHELNIGGGAVDLIKHLEPDASVVDRLEQLGMPKVEKIERSETEFDYTDVDGIVRYQVIRIDDKAGKTYRQRRIDEATGQPMWGMQGVTALPYRLHELANSTQPIFICEGEKAADAVAQLGLVATTNHGGAGKWWPSLTDWFRNRQVIIMPDNDAPGERHARIVADSLTGTAKSVRILQLPDLPPKGDVVEWLARGGSKNKLVDLVKQTPIYDPLDAEQVENLESTMLDGSEPRRIDATPFAWIDPSQIPMRRFIYGTHYIRQFVSLDVAPGGVGKSTLVIAEAIAIATGRPILGVKPTEKARVWYFNGEDPIDEINRRVVATLKYHSVSADDISGGLFLDSGRSQPIVIAHQTRDGAIVQEPVIGAVVEVIERHKIDVMILDPFVSTHQVSENDNNAIERVAKTWAHIADITGCAINLVHHSRKTGGAEVGVEDGRGASALASAARSARAFNQMNEGEARKAGVENRRSYFRTDNGKANLAPPSNKATWYRLVSVPLSNGPGGTDGDMVGVVTSWEWPDHMAEVTVEQLRGAQREVAKGGPWRANAQSKDWVGVPIARALNVDMGSIEGKAKVASILKMWISNGMFVEVKGKDSKRMTRLFVEVGEWAND